VVQGLGKVRAWKIPHQHGDALATDIPFLTKLSDDISNPQFPSGSSATASQLITALDNQSLYSFYKQFADFSYLNNGMRRRYLEVLTLNDANSRIPLLQNILQRRSIFYNFVKTNYSNSVAKTLKPKNFLYGQATYKIDGIEQPTLYFFSVSGFHPSGIIVTNNPQINFGSMDNNVIRDVIPNSPDAFTSGTYDGTKRFFEPQGFDDVERARRQWDTEAKSIEIIVERIGVERGISVGNRTTQSYQQIVEGTDLNISLFSEMDACSSCQDIIKGFNNAAPNGVQATVQGGTKYYEIPPSE